MERTRYTDSRLTYFFLSKPFTHSLKEFQEITPLKTREECMIISYTSPKLIMIRLSNVRGKKRINVRFQEGGRGSEKSERFVHLRNSLVIRRRP